MAHNVLVTNDDGIDSPGLWALVRAFAPTADYLYVVAPSVNQSAVGAGITLRRQLRWERLADPPVPGVEAWHVDGTPADCVMIGLRQIVRHWIDTIVSGVNQGANVGNDILASGTVGGALQGHFRDLTSMAFSQQYREGEPIDWTAAERIASLLARSQVAGSIPESVFLNVNIPPVPFEALAGVLVTRAGREGYLRLAEVDGHSAVVERDTNLHTNPGTPPGTDIWALLHNYVSVTPLQANLTDHRLIDMLGERLNAAFVTES